MKINFLGDSITQGAMAESEEGTFVAQVGKILKAEVANFGVGGTRIAKQKITFGSTDYDEDFLTRAQRMGDADLVCVFGGTNDFGHGDAPLGEPSSHDSYTFYGAVRNLCDYLINKYGKEKLFFILPLHRYDENNVHGEFGVAKKDASPLLCEYSRIIEEVVGSYNIPILDVKEKMGCPKGNKPEELFYDGLHPNQKGHTLLAKYVADYIERTFLK